MFPSIGERMLIVRRSCRFAPFRTIITLRRRQSFLSLSLSLSVLEKKSLSLESTYAKKLYERNANASEASRRIPREWLADIQSKLYETGISSRHSFRTNDKRKFLLLFYAQRTFKIHFSYHRVSPQWDHPATFTVERDEERDLRVRSILKLDIKPRRKFVIV